MTSEPRPITPEPAQGYALTLLEAAAACGVHKNTVRRYLRAGRFPNARRKAAGSNAPWLVPAADLEAAGLRPHRPTTPDPQAPAEPAVTSERIVTLERELVEERERRKGAEALAHERLQRVEDLRQTLRLLEAGAAEPQRRSYFDGKTLTDDDHRREQEHTRDRRSIPVQDLGPRKDSPDAPRHDPNLLEAGFEFADAVGRAFFPWRRRR